jgi:CBS domain-containing protein
MLVRELMRPEVWDTFPEESVADAAERMRDHGVGSLPVVEGQELLGILTERDVLRAVADGAPLRVTPVSAYMTAGAVVASSNTDAASAVQLMVQHDVRHLPIVEGGKLVGMVSARDLLAFDASRQA